MFSNSLNPSRVLIFVNKVNINFVNKVNTEDYECGLLIINLRQIRSFIICCCIVVKGVTHLFFVFPSKFIKWIVADLKCFNVWSIIKSPLTETNVFEIQKRLMVAIMCHEFYLAILPWRSEESLIQHAKRDN